MTLSKTTSVETFIGSFPNDVQAILKQIRTTIKQAVPNAEETISYGMPAYKLNGNPLVYFAAFNNHIGFYPTPTAH